MLSLQPVPMETVGLEINRDLRFGLTAAFVLTFLFPSELERSENLLADQVKVNV